jgi:hypothetical protein
VRRIPPSADDDQVGVTLSRVSNDFFSCITGCDHRGGSTCCDSNVVQPGVDPLARPFAHPAVVSLIDRGRPLTPLMMTAVRFCRSRAVTGGRMKLGFDNVDCVNPRLTRGTESAACFEDVVATEPVVDSGKDSARHAEMDRYNDRRHATADK